MGRPIKKSFFANLNSPYQNQAQGGPTGQGGEGIASISTSSVATLYATANNVPLTISAPNLGGGTQAAATVNIAGGTISSISITTTGSGYTSAPTVTLTAVTTTGTTATFTASLTATEDNGIACTAYLSTGTTGLASDIMKQESSRRYLVINSEGKGVCKLVTASPAAGEMTIIAKDQANNQYYVKKLTARRAVLIQKSGSGYEYDDNEAAGWTLGAASAGVVTIVNN